MILAQKELKFRIKLEFNWTQIIYQTHSVGNVTLIQKSFTVIIVNALKIRLAQKPLKFFNWLPAIVTKKFPKNVIPAHTQLFNFIMRDINSAKTVSNKW